MKCKHIVKHTEKLIQLRYEPKGAFNKWIDYYVIITWCADCGNKLKEVEVKF